MKIGVWMRYGYSPLTGGGFSYFDAFVSKLKEYQFKNGVEWCFVTPASTSEDSNVVCLGLVPNNNPLIRKLTKKTLYLKIITKLSLMFKKKQVIKKLVKNDISILYYCNQNEEVITDFPFISTVWDMGYFATFPFPELIEGRNYKGRMKYFNKILPKALMIMAESETGKADLVKYAGITPDKVRVLPIFAGNVINQNVAEEEQNNYLQQYGLKDNKFFFYPAQFWAHKNHIGILRAFSTFTNNHKDYKIVFTGGDKGNLDYVKAMSENLSLTDSVCFLGYVSMEALYTFYKKCTALVMASYFGPTNMPPIEAMNLGCPVICTDIGGHREILAEAALYFDAISSNSLYKRMEEMVKNRELYMDKIIKRKTESPFSIDNAFNCLDKYFSEALTIRSMWG